MNLERVSSSAISQAHNHASHAVPGMRNLPKADSWQQRAEQRLRVVRQEWPGRGWSEETKLQIDK